MMQLVGEEVDSYASERDQRSQPIPPHVLRRIGDLGLLSYTLPVEWGGAGHSLQEWGSVLERLGYACGDLSLSLLISLFAGVCQALADAPACDPHVVRAAARGEMLVAFAYSEDADAFSFRTSVVRNGSEFALNGAKSIVTGGLIADAFLVYAREVESGDMVAAIVERSRPGLVVSPVQSMGARSAGLATLSLTDVRVPLSHLWVPSDGLGHVQRFLNRRRVLLCCGPVGRARRMIEECAVQVLTTMRYGRRLGDLPNVQAAFGRMRIALHTARTVLNDAFAQPDTGKESWTATSALAKYVITEQCLAIAHEVGRVAGGRGYAGSCRFERDVRDFHGLIAGAGAQDILLTDLGMDLLSTADRDLAGGVA
jgi:alkylation response protein AidB-like acyl-CoA dehydrogenase